MKPGPRRQAGAAVAVAVAGRQAVGGGAALTKGKPPPAANVPPPLKKAKVMPPWTQAASSSSGAAPSSRWQAPRRQPSNRRPLLRSKPKWGNAPSAKPAATPSAVADAEPTQEEEAARVLNLVLSHFVAIPLTPVADIVAAVSSSPAHVVVVNLMQPCAPGVSEVLSACDPFFSGAQVFSVSQDLGVLTSLVQKMRDGHVCQHSGHMFFAGKRDFVVSLDRGLLQTVQANFHVLASTHVKFRDERKRGMAAVAVAAVDFRALGLTHSGAERDRYVDGVVQHIRRSCVRFVGRVFDDNRKYVQKVATAFPRGPDPRLIEPLHNEFELCGKRMLFPAFVLPLGPVHEVITPAWLSEAADLFDWPGQQSGDAFCGDLLLPQSALPFLGGEDDPAVAGTGEPLLPSLGKVKLKAPNMQLWHNGMHCMLLYIGTARRGSGRTKEGEEKPKGKGK